MFHKNWINVPKDGPTLDKYLNLRRPQAELLIGLAELMSHIVYDDADEFNYADTGMSADDIELVKKIRPVLEETEGDIFDVANTAYEYVRTQRFDKKKTPQQAQQEFKEALEEASEKKKVKQKRGNKTGPPGGYLWQGEWYKMPLDVKKLKQWPAVSAIDIVQNGLSKSQDNFVPGKPKEIKVRKFARSVSDIRYCSSSALAMPPDLFWLIYAKGQLEVSLPHKKVTTKQIKVVLLDDSSSMDTTFKKDWLVKIFGTILLDILAGNSVMYFSPFLTMRNPLWKIETEEDVQSFCDNFHYGSGGGTSLADFLPELITQIQSGTVDGLPINPKTEILIVNDGQDLPGEFTSPIPIHCISVEDYNADVHATCAQTKGQYYTASSGGTLQLH